MTRHFARRRLRAKLVMKNAKKFDALLKMSYEEILKSELVDDIVHEARTKIGYSKNTYRYDIFCTLRSTYFKLTGK